MKELDCERLSQVEKDIYQEACDALGSGIGAVDFVDRFFGPTGRLTAIGSSAAERKALVETGLYRWLQGRAGELRHQEAESFEQSLV